jgi:hypothetical protein
MSAENQTGGGCLCGGVRYRITGKVDGVTACHCSQCAKTSGHHVASAHCATRDFALEKEETLRWYRSSAEAERGFCVRCGGNLFWRRIGSGDTISITAGTLDRPTGLRMKYHIFCGSKSDYYELTDGLTQYEAWSGKSG